MWSLTEKPKDRQDDEDADDNFHGQPGQIMGRRKRIRLPTEVPFKLLDGRERGEAVQGGSKLRGSLDGSTIHHKALLHGYAFFQSGMGFCALGNEST